MRAKALKFSLIICLVALLLPLNASSRVLTGKAYQTTLRKYLAKAEKSITIAMYFIILEPKGKGPINELVDDLVEAQNRGVEVKVILEDTKLKENRLAFEKLRDNGVSVYFDTAGHLLHIKGVVIDDRYVFLGSANWSRAAIEKNYEATNFIDSAQDALVFKQYVDSIPLQDKDILLPITKGVGISQDFILLAKSGRKLLKSQANKQLDIYLLLRKIAQEKKTNSLSLDYDSLAKDMGYVAPQDLGTYRNQHHYFYERIHRLLARLKRYGLIAYKKGVVSFKAAKANDKTILIPFEYWQYSLNNKLSMRAKYMYLICLYEANRSSRYPFWFRSQKDMSKLYGISDTTISLGLQELEDKRIIEITRDRLNPTDFSARLANVYKMLALPKDIKK